MPRTDRALTRRERQIMDILYRRSRATAAEVMSDLSGEPNYSTVKYLPIVQGRFITDGDVAERRRVAVLGSKAIPQKPHKKTFPKKNLPKKKVWGGEGSRNFPGERRGLRRFAQTIRYQISE